LLAAASTTQSDGSACLFSLSYYSKGYGWGENKRADWTGWAAGPSVSFARASFVMCPAARKEEEEKGQAIKVNDCLGPDTLLLLSRRRFPPSSLLLLLFNNNSSSFFVDKSWPVLTG
jgi:hypothetical protein